MSLLRPCVSLFTTIPHTKDELPLLLLLSHFSRVQLCATHRWQPTRLSRPWDSPGKNTGVGCHFLLQCMKVKTESGSRSIVSPSDPMDCSPPGSSVHGSFQARVLEWVSSAFSTLDTTTPLWFLSFGFWHLFCLQQSTFNTCIPLRLVLLL